ncbi:MAG: SCO family protein [Planctomycetota bacterium]|jgi:protein SCO1/2|nr:SCO family protein [Planctomycetota bacterium]
MHLSRSTSRSGVLIINVTLVALLVLVCATFAAIYLRPGGVDTGRPKGVLPPIFHTAPAFELTNQAGQSFTKENLKGRIWVSNFMFTTCPSICPMLTARMKIIADKVASWDDVHLLSFSVDPEMDTPEVLHRYAESYGIDHDQWSFLTGDYKIMQGAIEEGFKISMGGPIDRSDLNSVMHGTRFVLGDGDGNIRGYYDVETDEGVELLVHEIKLLRQAQ